MTRETLEQRRAKHAWDKCADYSPEEVNIAKGLPALIMNSGLMQTLAFLEQKGGSCKKVTKDLREWLHKTQLTPTNFEELMEYLFRADSRQYQAVTAEAFAWLKWLRQLAPARKTRQEDS